ncbi:hypothetical protein BTVI_95052 [Pitangus sulphuratus]|nr:hypothetical protein BTVI_95052 [Pitangus sulphuratus]
MGTVAAFLFSSLTSSKAQHPSQACAEDTGRVVCTAVTTSDKVQVLISDKVEQGKRLKNKTLPPVEDYWGEETPMQLIEELVDAQGSSWRETYAGAERLSFPGQGPYLVTQDYMWSPGTMSIVTGIINSQSKNIISTILQNVNWKQIE